jgi:hypothetical protein
MPESPESFYARAMIDHMMEPCHECARLRGLIARAHPDVGMGMRFALWTELVLQDRTAHAIDIETDFAIAEGRP